jgi:hypothetical protein
MTPVFLCWTTTVHLGDSPVLLGLKQITSVLRDRLHQSSWDLKHTTPVLLGTRAKCTNPRQTTSVLLEGRCRLHRSSRVTTPVLLGPGAVCTSPLGADCTSPPGTWSRCHRSSGGRLHKLSWSLEPTTTVLRGSLHHTHITPLFLENGADYTRSDYVHQLSWAWSRIRQSSWDRLHQSCWGLEQVTLPLGPDLITSPGAPSKVHRFFRTLHQAT